MLGPSSILCSTAYWLHPFSGSGFCLQPQVYSFLFYFLPIIYFILFSFPVPRLSYPIICWVGFCIASRVFAIHPSLVLSLHPVYLKTSAPRNQNNNYFNKKKSPIRLGQKNRQRETKMWIPDIPQLFAADCILQPGLCTAVTKMGSIVFPWRMEMFTRPLTVVCSLELHLIILLPVLV